MNKLQENPYRVLFPMGWLLAFWGVFIWMPFALNIWPYPGLEHPQIMMGGFLQCFVVGFLMTAAPKFTGSYPSTKSELWISGVLAVSLILFSVSGFRGASYLISFGMFLFLHIFLFKRYRARRNAPPAPFVFIILGIFTGALSSLILALQIFGVVFPDVLMQMARLFFNQGFILSLVMGIGSRLVPALLGWTTSPLEGGALARVRPFIFLILGLISSYILEASQFEVAGRTLRCVLFSWLALTQWKIYRFPQSRTVQAKMLWVSAWFILFGLSGQIWDTYRIHFLHLMFIGGFGLMTFMVAVRVVLSHGHHGLDLEQKSKKIWSIGILIILAAVGRLAAGFIPSSYVNHLGYAALLWCLALVGWGFVFIPKILREKF